MIFKSTGLDRPVLFFLKINTSDATKFGLHFVCPH